MIDWNQVGTAVGLILVGAGSVLVPWIRSIRKKRKNLTPWDGITERRGHRNRLTGDKIVSLIEEDESLMPRHWMVYVDSRAAHKAANAVNPLAVRMSAMETELKGVTSALRDIEGTLNRVIGRLLPNEPIG